MKSALTLDELIKRVNGGPWCVRTLSSTLRLRAVDKEALEQVGEGLGRIFDLKVVRFYFEQPDKIRVESVGPLKLAFIVAGWRRLLIGPGILKVWDLREDPGKKIFSFDFGFLSRGVWEAFQPVALGRAVVGNRRALVLKLAGRTISGYKLKDRKAYVDERTGALLRLIRIGREGEVEAVRVFYELREVAPGLYLPAKAALYAGERKLAGYISAETIVANRPLPPEVFQPK